MDPNENLPPPLPEDWLDGVESKLAPAQPPTDRIAGGLELLARIDALRSVLGERRTELIEELGGSLRPGGKLEREGLGKLLVTKPSLGPKVTDDEAWRAWAIAEHPERCGTRRRLTVTDEAALLAVYDAASDPLAEPDPWELLRRFHDAVKAEEDTLVEESLLSDLWSSTPRPAPGPLVSEAGETIPGVEVGFASSPSLRATPDKGRIAELAGEARELLSGTLALPERSEP